MEEYIYDKEVLETFLAKQEQLFPETVAESLEEADEFLDEAFAVVVASKKEVIEYFEEAGVDFDAEDVLEAAEVFTLPSGRFLIVEG